MNSHEINQIHRYTGIGIGRTHDKFLSKEMSDRRLLLLMLTRPYFHP